MTTDAARATMTTQAERLAHADRERAASVRRLAKCAGILHDEGVPVAQIARLAGVSRVTVYRWLDG